MKKLLLCLFALLQLFVMCSCTDSIDKVHVNTVEKSDEELKIHFINLENGVCTFLELPNGESMLIDCGADTDFPKVCRYINENEFTIIDYLVVTNSDSAHIGGASKLLQAMQVNDMFISNRAVDSSLYKQTISSAANSRCNIEIVCGGSSIINDEKLCVSIVGPVEDYTNASESALSVLVSYKNRSFFFEGDCGEKTESDMLSSFGNYLKCDVIRIANCGGTKTSSPAFLQKLSPRFAVIPVYGKYSVSELSVTDETLEKLDCEVFKSNSCGTVLFTTNGSNMIVKTQR